MPRSDRFRFGAAQSEGESERNRSGPKRLSLGLSRSRPRSPAFKVDAEWLADTGMKGCSTTHAEHFLLFPPFFCFPFLFQGKPNNDTRESDDERKNQNQSFAPAYRGPKANPSAPLRGTLHLTSPERRQSFRVCRR